MKDTLVLKCPNLHRGFTLPSEDLVTFLLIPRNFQLQFPFQKRETFPESIPGIYFFTEKSPKLLYIEKFSNNPQYSFAVYLKIPEKLTTLFMFYHTDKKENKIFLLCKEIQSGEVAKSYMTL